ncbi:MAG: ion channel [Syntrophobacterales bacterium]|jgi:hypothetical protein|nr:ion channel [Syntrophobacterales bacterium]
MLKNPFSWLKSLRFLQLTVFILLLFLTMPFSIGHPILSIFFQLVLVNVLLVSLSASSLPKLRLAMLGLWLLGAVFFLKYTLFGGPGAYRDLLTAWVFYMMLLAVSIAATLVYIARSRRVTLDTIFAAVVAYFLLSIIFANFYAILFFYQPQAFNLPLSSVPNRPHGLMTEMLYFSLITIVGVGFGDIVPLLPFPRMVVAVEAVIGHFYITVLIAWLVGMFISQALISDVESVLPEEQAALEDLPPGPDLPE